MCFLEVFLGHAAVIMHSNVLVAEIRWKAGVQMTSNLRGKILVVTKDENVGLLVQNKGLREEALVVARIFNIVNNFVSCVHSVGTVRGDLNEYIIIA